MNTIELARGMLCLQRAPHRRNPPAMKAARQRRRRNAMKKILITAAALAMVPLAGMAAAGNKTPATPAGQSGSFDTLDSNKDGRISMPEASADPKLVESFSTADTNGGGLFEHAG